MNTAIKVHGSKESKNKRLRTKASKRSSKLFRQLRKEGKRRTYE